MKFMNEMMGWFLVALLIYLDCFLGYLLITPGMTDGITNSGLTIITDVNYKHSFQKRENKEAKYGWLKVLLRLEYIYLLSVYKFISMRINPNNFQSYTVLNLMS